MNSLTAAQSREAAHTQNVIAGVLSTVIPGAGPTLQRAYWIRGALDGVSATGHMDRYPARSRHGGPWPCYPDPVVGRFGRRCLLRERSTPASSLRRADDLRGRRLDGHVSRLTSDFGRMHGVGQIAHRINIPSRGHRREIGGERPSVCRRFPGVGGISAFEGHAIRVVPDLGQAR